MVALALERSTCVVARRPDNFGVSTAFNSRFATFEYNTACNELSRRRPNRSH
jgi:hypothetical protein